MLMIAAVDDISEVGVVSCGAAESLSTSNSRFDNSIWDVNTVGIGAIVEEADSSVTGCESPTTKVMSLLVKEREWNIQLTSRLIFNLRFYQKFWKIKLRRLELLRKPPAAFQREMLWQIIELCTAYGYSRTSTVFAWGRIICSSDSCLHPIEENCFRNDFSATPLCCECLFSPRYKSSRHSDNTEAARAAAQLFF